MDYPIVDVVRVASTGGRLALAAAPVRLSSNLGRIKSLGYDTIVCLLEDKEIASLKLGNYAAQVRKHGLLFHSLPIRDGAVPTRSQAWTLGVRIVDSLSTGRRIVIHCRRGLGRAGTICACSLVQLGWDPLNAVEQVRHCRPGAIQTRRQWLFVLTHSPSSYGSIVTSATPTIGTPTTLS